MSSSATKWLLLLLLSALLSICLAGCGKSSDDVRAAYDNSSEVDAYYRDHPRRFVFAKPAQLPTDLKWEDGSALPTFGDPRARRGGRLTVRISTMQQTLRVVGPDANGSLRGPLWSANSVGLIERHPWADGYTPGVARQWAIDPKDSHTVYLKLDPDARWSDGRPFTVEDIFFSLYFLLSPNIKDPAVNRVYDENIARITRYDAETVSITESNASPDPLFFISNIILSQRAFYREFGPDYVDRYHWRFAPVTGPYTLDPSKVDRGRQITFDRLPHWWADDKPFFRHRFNPDKLTFVVIRDDSKAFESFLKGDLDLYPLDQTELWYDRADAQPIVKGYIDRAQVFNQLPAARAGVYMNAMQPLLSDRTLRIGIQHAIDYERVNTGLYRGDRRRIHSFADGYGRYSDPTLRARKFDVNAARAKFAEAGFATLGSDGILVNAKGQRLSFVLTVRNGGDDVNVATILKEEAHKAGLELIIETLDPTAFFTKIFKKSYQLAIMSWSTGYSPLPAFAWEVRGEDAGKPDNFNTTNIKDEQLDALLARWDRLTDPAEAEQVSHKVQERVHDFAAWVPGLTTDYTRYGYWRWVGWPDYFQVPRYFFFMGTGVFWVDQDIKAETLKARQEGRTFPPVTKVYERWK